MSQTSPTLHLPLVQPAQAQKHVTVNEALLRLDALVRTVAESRFLAAQPTEPGEGAAWLIPAGASGDSWSGFAAGDLAVFRDGSWHAYSPRDRWCVHVRDEASDVRWDAGAQRWRRARPEHVLVEGDTGGATQAWLGDEVIGGLTGSSVQSTLVIPARSVVFAVSVRTRESITGALSFDCGIAGEPGKFGGSLGIAAGSSNIGVIGPTAFYADAPVVLTANGGDFAGGEVAIAIHAWRPVAPIA